MVWLDLPNKMCLRPGFSQTARLFLYFTVSVRRSLGFSILAFTPVIEVCTEIFLIKKCLFMFLTHLMF